MVPTPATLPQDERRASLAQHDRKKNVSFRAQHFPLVIPSVAEESRGNDSFLLPRDGALLLFRFYAAMVK